MTTEAKVGAFSLLGLLALVLILVHFSGFSPFAKKDYTIYVGFTQVLGLTRDSEVRYAGVPAGKVTNIEPDGLGVKVTLAIKPEIKIPKDSEITIASNSMLSDKFILIAPADAKSAEYLKNGDYVIGTDEESLGTLMTSVSKVVTQMQGLMSSLNDIMADPKMRQSILGSAENIEKITGNIRDLTGVMSRVAVANEGSAGQMVQRLDGILGNLQETTATVKQMMQDVEAKGETAANLRLTLENVKEASENVKRIAQGIANVAADPQVQQNAKSAIANANEVTQKANEMLSDLQDKVEPLQGLETNPTLETMYSGKEKDWNTNFAVDVNKGDRFLRLGVEDIGDGSNLDLEAGKKAGKLTYRGGIIHGKMGVGVDAQAGEKWQLSLDGYDPNDFQLRFGAAYKLTEDTSLIGQIQGLNDSDRRAAYFGVRRAF